MKRFPVSGVLAAALLLCLVWGCSKDKEYPQAIRDNFMTSCMDAAKDKLSEGQGAQADKAEERARAYCQCGLEKIMQRVPLDEFLAVDKAMSSKKAVDPETEKKLRAAISECQLETGKSQ